MKTVHFVTTYTIDDHPDKEAVFNYVRENWHDLYSWGEENVSSLKTFCDHFSLSGMDYGVGLCGYSFARATVDSELEELQGVRLWKYLQNSGLLDNNLLEGNCPFTGYCFDETLLDPIRAFITKPTSQTYQELIDDCLAAWVKAYVDDWEYTYTDESIEEQLLSNEYEFTLEGAPL